VLRFLSPEAEAALVRLIDERVSEQLQAASGVVQASSPWMTVTEAAEHLRTTPGAIYKRVKRGQLEAFRPEGSPILLRRGDLDRAGPRRLEVL
jgi:excisionase family DNA binding protein